MTTSPTPKSSPPSDPAGSNISPALTKIIATLGPASDDDRIMEKMVLSGATTFRLNFSHGDMEEHTARLQRIRHVSQSLGIPLAALADLPGPKLRLGEVPDEGIELEAGTDVIIDPGITTSSAGPPVRLATNYPTMAAEVEVGHRVLINDGAVRMLVVEAGDGVLRCRVVTGGIVTSRKGVNLPDSDLSVPAITERDWRIVDWAMQHCLDFLAMSFVRTAENINRLHAHMRQAASLEAIGAGLVTGDCPPMIPVIAKIETPQAVANIAAIVDAADAIMVARGDLGVELDLASVPLVQKRLIKIARSRSKPVIVATQMLESMIQRRHPTRAEVSDVANAILDKADALMLSGETAVGKWPVFAVETMRRVAIATEPARQQDEAFTAARAIPPAAPPPEQIELIPALAHGACIIAREAEAKLIVVWSQRGGLARFLSRHNFNAPIVAFSSDPIAVRRMNLLFGIVPMHMPEVPQHRSDFARRADQIILEEGLAQRGDIVVLMGGKPLDQPGSTNTLAIRRAGDLSG